MLDVSWSLLIDGVNGLVNREDVIDSFDKALRPVNESTWGTDPEAVAGQRAMMELAGGPAPLRDPTTAPAPESRSRARQSEVDEHRDGDR